MAKKKKVLHVVEKPLKVVSIPKKKIKEAKPQIPTARIVVSGVDFREGRITV